MDIKKIYIIENNTVNPYGTIRISKSNINYIYKKKSGEARIAVNSEDVFLSEIRALTTLEERLVSNLDKIRLRLGTRKGNFLGTDNLEQFKKSIQGIEIDEIQKEITKVSYSEALYDGDDTIYKKKT